MSIRLPHSGHRLLRRSLLIGTITVAGAALGMPAASAAAVSTGATYGMDETSGRTMVDSSGNGTDGVIKGGVTTGVPGVSGTGYRFDGRSGVVTVRSRASLNPGTADFAVGVWVKVPTRLPLGDYNVWQKGISRTTGGQYKLELRASNSHNLATPRCTLRGSAGKVLIASTTKLNDGRWHHVACARRGGIVSITVDGATRSVRANIGAVANTAPLTIGAAGEKRSDYYLGDLDSFTLSR